MKSIKFMLEKLKYQFHGKMARFALKREIDTMLDWEKYEKWNRRYWDHRHKQAECMANMTHILCEKES